MPNLLGTAPNQVPTNGDLGKLAFMDVVDTVTNNPYLDTAISDTKPSLLLDFANSKTLDPRITYTRASTASYYDGKTTAVAEQNLLTYSQEFDNAAWSKTTGSITANATTAPDGTTTADLFNEAVSGRGELKQGFYAVSGFNYTLSVFAKENASSAKRYIAIATGSGGFGSQSVAIYDLSTGTKTYDNGNGTNYTITSAGNGWWRITNTDLSTVNASDATFNLYTSESSTSITSSGGGSIYIWGAQLEQRSTVTAYTPTTSSPITNYIPALQTAAAGVPRFDHDPVTGESKGFLIEEQRTNLLTYSADFSNAAWTKSNTTVTADIIVAPDGAQTADLVLPTTSNNVHFVINQVTSTLASTAYTYSVYAKASGYSYLVCRIDGGGTSGAYATFNVLTGSTSVSGTTFGSGWSNASSSITNVGNGWYRCTVSAVTGSSNYIRPINFISNISCNFDGNVFSGDGYSGIYIWGAQLEAGSFATSYIPTTSAQVTRSADAASMAGTNFSSWYRADEGTLYAEAQAYNSTATASSGGYNSSLYGIGDNGSNNYLASWRATTSNQLASFVRVNGVTQAEFNSGAVANGASFKHALALKTNDFANSLNGGAVASDTSGALPVSTQMSIGSAYNSSVGYWNGTIKKLAYYPKRLSDAELQEMTL